VDGTAGNSTMRFAFTNSGQIINNAADIELRGANANVHFINNSGTDLLNSFASNTGSFTISNGYSYSTPGNFSNSGTVTAASNSNFTTPGNFTNTGTVAVTNTSNLTAQGDFTNTGMVTVGDASVLTAVNYNQAAGLTLGTGTINATVNVTGGAVSPGLSPGTLAINGNFSLNNGTFIEEIAGAGAGQFDVLNVFAGDIFLGANAFLDIDLVNGFNPTNQSFTIMTDTGGSISGIFANAPSSGFDMDGYHWTIAYNLDSIVLYGPTAPPAPLPATWILLGSAILGLAGWRTRQR
jgi:hypothetical protein